MSFFFLTAVKGDMPVHILELIIIRRLDYLKDVLKGNTLVYNEYVVEGSLYDNASHFMLCVIAILGENVGFTQFFLRAEVELFSRRLASLTAYDIRSFAKKLIRSIRKHAETVSFFDPLLALLRHLIIKDMAQHLCLSTHKTSCKDHNIKLNFKHCLDFIARREVELRNGVAFIPCSKWKQYLSILFRNNLRLRIQKTDLAPLKSDTRVMDLLMKMKSEFFPCIVKSPNTLLSREVDSVSKWFPPCMLNLHNNLRNKHRLSHTQRFHYSLFLKDIGLPIEEAVDFWRLEYRQSPNGNHACCHNWEKDEKKYLYGIRHMYGLEGCKKNYTSVNCQRIQSLDNACSEGGCPFKSFDNPKMIKLLQNSSETILAEINELRRKNMYTLSCMLYLNSIGEKNCDNYSFNFTPVKYYTIASKGSSCTIAPLFSRFALSPKAAATMKGAAFPVKYDGEIYDLKKFLRDHPGGVNTLQVYEGKSIKNAMQKFGHSNNAYHMLNDLKVAGEPEDANLTGGLSANGRIITNEEGEQDGEDIAFLEELEVSYTVFIAK
ncbi:DNA primase large subunit [Operophtera brumata]|uniref:DNA primase large subunit n=1 Tax=Operophtera brumata TaxID=104452 RepID=A0A0L7L272_OPEBR|nr:DNA primase large subunit [Operophtera brumata]